MELGIKFVPDDTVHEVKLGGEDFSVLLLKVMNFTLILTCIIVNFILNNQPDALIIPVSFSYKTLHVSGIFSARHQEFSTVWHW
jgi:hypothetical protein